MTKKFTEKHQDILDAALMLRYNKKNPNQSEKARCSISCVAK